MSTIRPATDADVEQLAVTATRAFVADPVMRWFFPDDDDWNRFGPLVNRTPVRRSILTATQWCTDDGVALASWLPPGRPQVDVERPDIDHPPWRMDRFAVTGDAMRAHTPDERHWYLGMLCTHPDWQRRGLASALLDVVFAIADRDGLACYLETLLAENVAFYGHHGFTVRSEWDLCTADDQGPHMWGMLRPPR